MEVAPRVPAASARGRFTRAGARASYEGSVTKG